MVAQSQFAMDMTSLIGLFGGGAVIVGAVTLWLSRLMTERVLSKWRREEQSFVEIMRAEQARHNLLLEAGIKGFGAGQDVICERRVIAVEHLWANVLLLRERFQGPVFFFGILLPSEYDAALRKQDAFSASVQDVDERTTLAAIKETAALEGERPHLGETLWLRFFIYRAFLGRLAHLITEGKRTGHILDWRQDSGVRQLLGHIVQQPDLSELLKSTSPVSINWALNALEGLLLEEISRITSGQHSALESFENAKALRSAMSNTLAGKLG